MWCASSPTTGGSVTIDAQPFNLCAVKTVTAWICYPRLLFMESDPPKHFVMEQPSIAVATEPARAQRCWQSSGTEMMSSSIQLGSEPINFPPLRADRIAMRHPKFPE
jgi:hypothetical protein